MKTKEIKTSDLLKMARGPKPKAKPAKEKVVETKIIKPKTEPEEDRDTKARKTVEKLLEGINLNPNENKIDNTLINNVYEDESSENTGGNEWLEQQVSDLTEMNEYLRNQLANLSSQPDNQQDEQPRYNNQDIVLEDNNIKINVVKLFTELQTAYINVGFNYNVNPPKSNLIIYPEQFMSRLLNFFPFLENYRKVQLP